MSQLQITFRSIANSSAVKYYVEKYFNKINRMYHRIQKCRVTIETTKKHSHKGKIFLISINITVPGKELVTRKKNNNLYVAIRDGFDTIEKLLDKYCKRTPDYYEEQIKYIKNKNQSNPIEMGFS